MPDNPKGNPYIKDRLLQHAVVESEPGKYQWRYDENRRSLGKLFTWRDLGAFGSFAGAISAMIG